MSPWWAGYLTTWENLDYGHSLSLYQRMLKHGWFAGAGLVTPENSVEIVFNNNNVSDGLNSWGVEQAKTYAFMLAHDRGVPYMPVAIVLDHYAGYNGYSGTAWNYYAFTAADLEIDNLFTEQLFPGSDHIHHDPFPDNKEKTFLVATPYGEICDVFLSTVKSDVLSSYPVILLAGDITFDDGFKAQLLESVQAGSKLLLHPRHQTALGAYYTTLDNAGDVEVLSVSGQAISNAKLAEINTQHLPVLVKGDPVQYQINRNQKGWVVELVHNSGVWKQWDSSAVVNPSDVAHVWLEPKVRILAARKWGIDSSGNADDIDIGYVAGSAATPIITVGPGESVYIELDSAMATTPVPGDDSKGVDFDQELSWSAGTGAALHYVYISTNFDEVVNGTIGSIAYQGSTDGDKWGFTETFEAGKKYYWRIDTLDSLGGITTGDIWSFTTKYPQCDFEPDGDVDIIDLVYFTNCWLGLQEQSEAADLDGDGSVVMEDFAIFAENWDWPMP
jgi:hypothetical protein